MNIVDIDIPKYSIYTIGGNTARTLGKNQISGLMCKNAVDGSYITKINAKSG